MSISEWIVTLPWYALPSAMMGLLVFGFIVGRFSKKKKSIDIEVRTTGVRDQLKRIADAFENKTQ